MLVSTLAWVAAPTLPTFSTRSESLTELAPHPKLFFLTSDRRRSVFKADPWPAPFHLGRALFGAHYLTPMEKLRVAWGMLALLRAKPDDDPPLLDWLLAHRQTRRIIDHFWGVVLVSALNESVEKLGLKYARKVFVEGFLRHRDGHVVHVPTVPLGELYGATLRNWFARHSALVRENAGVKQLVIPPGPAPPPCRASRPSRGWCRLGRMNVTRLPWLGPWQILPCQARGLRSVPQPERSPSAISPRPGRAATAEMSSSRAHRPAFEGDRGRVAQPPPAGRSVMPKARSQAGPLPRDAPPAMRARNAAALARLEHVQRAAHRPGPHEPPVGERRLHLAGPRALPSHADGQLGRRGHLRLHAAEPPDDLDRPDRAQRTREGVAAVATPGPAAR